MNAPAVLDMTLIRNFMWSIGPISSVFDFITFGVLLMFFDADQALFQTGWFVESLCTQVMVIFIIRTRANPLVSKPHPGLIVAAFLVLSTAMLLPYSVLGKYFGFIPLPAEFFVVLLVMLVLYLIIVEWAKRRFYHLYAL
ncbi:MAG: cation transporting ATPase C-terminal domain-containing protein [bacterium]